MPSPSPETEPTSPAYLVPYDRAGVPVTLVGDGAFFNGRYAPMAEKIEITLGRPQTPIAVLSVEPACNYADHCEPGAVYVGMDLAHLQNARLLEQARRDGLVSLSAGRERDLAFLDLGAIVMVGQILHIGRTEFVVTGDPVSGAGVPRHRSIIEAMLTSTRVSGDHCKIQVNEPTSDGDPAIRVWDFGSYNGTYLRLPKGVV